MDYCLGHRVGILLNCLGITCSQRCAKLGELHDVALPGRGLLELLLLAITIMIGDNMKSQTTYREIQVHITKRSDGSAVGTVWCRMMNGILFPAVLHEWTSGAPTPAQVELFEAGLDEQLHHLILAFLGVQGVLSPALDAGLDLPVTED